jgi:CRP-like cAMP-binding protein|tara:strand:+ start:483 stop:656 length:174 start_codon:yes stop_codon:yes gene_type:complete
LLLNTLGEKEILGETSTILYNKRSVTAQAGSKGASAVYLDKKDFEATLNINTSLKAI